MNRIHEIRVEHEIKQKDLADQLGWTTSRLSNYESGLRTPSLEASRDIVAAFQALGVKCSLDEVFPPKGKKDQAA